MAKLYFRYGAMGSSKTANAIMVRHNYLERGQKVLMLKPKLDNRDGETIIGSRCGLTCECHFIEDIDQFDVTEFDCPRLRWKNWWRLWKRKTSPSSPMASVPISRAIFLKAASGCWPGPTPSKR